MALYKRGKTWHTDFSVDGQRFRQSLDTTDWREAQAQRESAYRRCEGGQVVGNETRFCTSDFPRGCGVFPTGSDTTSRTLERSDRARTGESDKPEA